ncbi:MAG: SpoIID/LytB domain-containing protein [Acidobacteriota bacterium]
MRVGLGTDYRSLDVVALGKVQMWQGSSGQKYLGEVSGPIYAELSAEALLRGAHLRYSVQVGSFARAEDAAAVASQIEKDAAIRAFVNEVAALRPSDPNRSPVYHVRAGPFAGEAEAEKAQEFLAANGYPDCFVQEESYRGAYEKGLRLVVNRRLYEHVEDGTIYLVPSTAEPMIQIGSKRYRGVLKICVNSSSRLSAINVLNIEDYLRGVVPNELSPASFPQLEALKAQAVAARTYALKNMDQFEGYDICATAVCQVYEGASSENPLSDEAVRATAGEVAVYKGELINAMYTSTCGGSTEAAEKVFEGRGAPYLRPVQCYPERIQEFELLSGLQPLEDHLSPALAVLRCLGVMDAAGADLDSPASTDEIAGWVERAIAACHRTGVGMEPTGIDRIGPLVTYVLTRFGWTGRRDMLIPARDVDLVLSSFQDAGSIDPADRRSIAYVLNEKWLTPRNETILGSDAPPTRRQLVQLLYGLVQTAENPLQAATFLGAKAQGLELQVGTGQRYSKAAADMAIFRSGSPAVQVRRAVLIGGEQVRYVLNGSGEAGVLFIDPLDGAGSDRASKYYRWDVRTSIDDLDKRLARNYAYGRLIDLEVTGTGESQRVTELLVKGTEGNVVLRGIKIRWALGLRDNLFLIDRVYGGDGKISGFQFTGKGWGHGVGLCQVGAYGMALRGADYREILKSYYTGIEIVRR